MGVGRVRRLGSVLATAVAFTLIGAAATQVVAQAAGPGLSPLSSDTFKNASTASPNWMKPAGSNVACLTAGSNTSQQPIPGCGGTTDAAGNGALRLTQAVSTQVGTVYSTVSLPTSKG